MVLPDEECMIATKCESQKIEMLDSLCGIYGYLDGDDFLIVRRFFEPVYAIRMPLSEYALRNGFGGQD